MAAALVDEQAFFTSSDDEISIEIGRALARMQAPRALALLLGACGSRRPNELTATIAPQSAAVRDDQRVLGIQPKRFTPSEPADEAVEEAKVVIAVAMACVVLQPQRTAVRNGPLCGLLVTGS